MKPSRKTCHDTFIVRFGGKVWSVFHGHSYRNCFSFAVFILSGDISFTEGNMKNRFRTLIPLLLALALLSACAQPSTSSQATDSTSVPIQTTASEATVKETESSLRVISTVPSVTEILYALGAGDEVIGVDVSSTYPEQTASVEKVGDYNGFDVEKIISLEPDVVFVGKTIQDDQITQLQNAGLKTVDAEARSFDDISKMITLVGQTVNFESEAKALNDRIAEAVTAATDAGSALSTHPTVYYVMGIGEYGNWTSGEGSFINEIFEKAGGVCVTAGTGNAWIEYPVEDLVAADPDMLLVSSYISLDDLKKAEGYKDLTAVKEGRVYMISPDIIERPGPRIADAITEIQKDIAEVSKAE